VPCRDAFSEPQLEVPRNRRGGHVRSPDLRRPASPFVRLAGDHPPVEAGDPRHFHDRVTNAVSEELKNKNKGIKRIGFWYRNSGSGPGGVP